MIAAQYIKNHFGSKRGLLRACFAEFVRSIGYYNRFSKIDFQKVNRLIFVCNGNICRSPLGEAVARSQGVATASYGLDTRGGDSADPRALAFGGSIQVLFHEHKTRKMKDYHPAAGDLLVGMEPRHTSQLVALYGDQVQITLAGLWLRRPRAYIHDPYNTNATFFNRCESLVEQSATKLVQLVNQRK